MQSVKQSLLVLNRASNWRDGFVNVVRLATSEPGVTRGVDGEIWLRDRERWGRAGVTSSLPERKGTRLTWEIRRSDERLERAFKVGKGKGLGRDTLEQGGRRFWE